MWECDPQGNNSEQIDCCNLSSQGHSGLALNIFEA